MSLQMSGGNVYKVLYRPGRGSGSSAGRHPGNSPGAGPQPPSQATAPNPDVGWTCRFQSHSWLLGPQVASYQTSVYVDDIGLGIRNKGLLGHIEAVLTMAHMEDCMTANIILRYVGGT